MLQLAFSIDVPSAAAEGDSLATHDVLRGVRPLLQQQSPLLLLHVHARSPGAALSLNENCDPSVRADIRRALRRLLLRSSSSSSAAAATAFAAASAALVGSSLLLPCGGKSFQLGTWQGVHLWAAGGGGVSHVDFVATAAPCTKLGSFGFQPPSRGAHSIRAQIERQLPPSGGGSGLCVALAKHTSCSLVAAAADAAGTLETAASSALPDAWSDDLYEHTMEGRDDMPAHAKCSVLGAFAVLPTRDGALRLGDAQDVLLVEHRDGGGWGGGGRRTVVVASIGSGNGTQEELAVDVPAGRGWAALGAALQQRVASAPAHQVGLLHVHVLSRSAAVLVVSSTAAADVEGVHASLSSATAAGSAQDRAAMLGLSVLLPVRQGHLELGQHQDVFVFSTAVDIERVSLLLTSIFCELN